MRLRQSANARICVCACVRASARRHEGATTHKDCISDAHAIAPRASSAQAASAGTSVSSVQPTV
eukprot:6204681-Pleurochrysis_carterae.AAC.1